MPRAVCFIAVVALSGCQTWMERTYLPSPRVPKEPMRYVAPPDRLPMPRELPDEPKRVIACLSPAAATVKLAVANVQKEEVILFALEGGSLVFVRKLPPGEAADLSVLPGSKLAATFSGAPHCENYTAKGTEGEVWLLRPAPPGVL